MLTFYLLLLLCCFSNAAEQQPDFILERRQAFYNMQELLPRPQDVPRTKPDQIRIVTFNVGRFTSFINQNDSFTSIIRDLVALEPDIIALQEVVKSRIADLEMALPKWYHLRCKYSDHRYMVTLIRESRFYLLDQEIHQFWDRCIPVIRLSLKLDSSRLIVANVHLSHILKGIRNGRQLSDIIAKIEERSCETIILGDFNMKRNPIEYVQEQIPQRYRLISNDKSGFFSHWRGFTVDHILATERIKKISGGFVRQLGSDHTLMYLDFRIR